MAVHFTTHMVAGAVQEAVQAGRQGGWSGGDDAQSENFPAPETVPENEIVHFSATTVDVRCRRLTPRASRVEANPKWKETKAKEVLHVDPSVVENKFECWAPRHMPARLTLVGLKSRRTAEGKTKTVFRYPPQMPVDVTLTKWVYANADDMQAEKTLRDRNRHARLLSIRNAYEAEHGCAAKSESELCQDIFARLDRIEKLESEAQATDFGAATVAPGG